MKKVILIMLMLTLIGCESEDVTNDKVIGKVSGANTNNYYDELHDAKIQISEFEETNKRLNNILIQMEEDIEKDTSRQERTEDILRKITEMEKFEYEVLSVNIDRSPFDSVVYVVNVPDRLDEQEIYVIRSAIQFAEQRYTKVSLWKDRPSAMKYINGEYDNEESEFGWSGFDQMFGFIDNTSNPPNLSHFFSRDDGQVIEFGKYSYDK